MRFISLLFLAEVFCFLHASIATFPGPLLEERNRVTTPSDYSDLAYSYQRVREAEMPLSFVSWEEVLEYIEWQNSSSEKALSLICNNPEGFNIDSLLKSNRLTFCITFEEELIDKMGKKGSIGNKFCENILILGALILSGRSAGEENAVPRELPIFNRLTRSSSEPILSEKESLNRPSLLPKSKSMNDLDDLRSEFAFGEENSMISKVQPLQKMTPSLPVQGSLPLLVPTEIKPVVEKGEFEGKEITTSEAAYDHQSISDEVKEQTIAKERSKKKVTFSLPEPILKSLPKEVVRHLYSEEEYERAKSDLENRVAIFKQKSSLLLSDNLSSEEKKKELEEIATLCGQAAHLMRIASQTIDYDKMEPMIHQLLCYEKKKKVNTEEIEFPFRRIDWGEMTQAEKHDIFLLDRVNAVLKTLYNFQDTLLSSEKEVGVELLLTQTKYAKWLYLIDSSITGVGKDRGKYLDKRDKEIDQIVDPKERIEERKKVRACRDRLYEAWKETVKKEEESLAYYKGLSDRYIHYIKTGEESVITFQGVEAYKEAIKESLQLISETLALSSELVKMLETKKRE